jgi:hypothetical protein
MNEGRAPRRRPGSAFPEITGILLLPVGAKATLLNLSATGVLVECASRQVPGRVLTVKFEGTFSPASIEARVIRCEVTGIASDGSIRFHLALMFSTRLSLADDPEDDAEESTVAKPSAPAVAAAAPEPPVLRNRW